MNLILMSVTPSSSSVILDLFLLSIISFSISMSGQGNDNTGQRCFVNGREALCFFIIIISATFLLFP